MGLRKILDDVEHHFQEGGRFQKWYALFEVFDTFLYAPDSVTRSTAHVRDGVDLKRIMITVWFATFPAMFYGMYNLGFQATDAMAAGAAVEGWHGWLIELLGGYDAGNLWHAAESGVLAEIDSPVLEANVPANLRDSEGRWFGLSERARTIVYSTERVTPGQLSSYEDLADPKWRGRLCLRTSKKVYNQSLVAMMIAQKGEVEAEKI